MEPEDSLPSSQQPTTCPYQVNSVQASLSYFLKIRVNIILPFTLSFSKWPLSHMVT